MRKTKRWGVPVRPRGRGPCWPRARVAAMLGLGARASTLYTSLLSRVQLWEEEEIKRNS